MLQPRNESCFNMATIYYFANSYGPIGVDAGFKLTLLHLPTRPDIGLLLNIAGLFALHL